MIISTFSFCKTRSAWIMYKTRWQDSCYLVFGSNTSSYREFLCHEKPDLIIWMWDYTWVDQDTLRIETYCNDSLSNDSTNWCETVKYPLYVPNRLPLGFKTGNNMGNGYRNTTCYTLLKQIESEKSDAKLLFIHIPKIYNRGSAITEVSYLIHAIRQWTII